MEFKPIEFLGYMAEAAPFVLASQSLILTVVFTHIVLSMVAFHIMGRRRTRRKPKPMAVKSH